MDWEHSVNIDWLKARRDVVTATELVGLLPEFKRMTKAGANKIAPAFAALWGEKHCECDPDPKSYGPAARGHIMEPYAIDAWNKQHSDPDYDENVDIHWHWDDCIICNNGLGFSPDAMNIQQSVFAPRMDVFKGNLTCNGICYGQMPTSIIEVKSYSPDHHYKNMVSDKMSKQLEKERLQICVAFMVLPSLEEAKLLQYCPQAVHGMYAHVYTRTELEPEMEVLDKVLDLWLKTCRELEAIKPQYDSVHTEEEIYKLYLMDKEDDVFSLR